MPLRVQGQICLLLLLAAASAVSAKKLVIFGDSISDNGNGEEILLLTSGTRNGLSFHCDPILMLDRSCRHESYCKELLPGSGLPGK